MMTGLLIAAAVSLAILVAAVAAPFLGADSPVRLQVCAAVAMLAGYATGSTTLMAFLAWRWAL